MTLRPLSKLEYSVLGHFSEKGTMNSNDFKSVQEYNTRADVAIDLFRRGMLLSEAIEPFRKNRGLSDEKYLEIGVFRLSPRAQTIVGGGYWSHVAKALLVWLITSGALVAVLVGIFL